ncbi:MAG: TolC family protein [Roseovarius sp.]|nr:TolC family protein [Roseovarius sp.]
MINNQKIRIAVILSPLVLAGCVTASDGETYMGLNAGFSTVEAETRLATGKQAVWVQNREQAQDLTKRVHGMVHKKTINADTAVQVALLNNKGLQASYAEVGMSSAEAWQQTMLENPTVSIGVLGLAAPELGAYRAIEGMIASNILAIMTRERRVDIADTRFRQAQQSASLATLTLAAETRTAWINAVSAFETVTYLNRALIAADAASELAKELGKTGALGKSGQARQHVFYAELTGMLAEARLAANLAKEELTRRMGLWGTDVDYFVPNALPRVPGQIKKQNSIEKEALDRRVDLQLAKLELEAVAKSYGLTEATRFLTDFEIISGFEAEREIDDDVRKTTTTPQIEFEFVIPIFDSGEARMRKAEVAYMRAANMLAEKAVNIRSEARSAYTNYRSTHDIALHYKRNVLPLRTTIDEEALLTYNGMITSTFELLADTRAQISSLLLSVGAKKAFWLADANLSATIYGGGAASGGSAPAANVADGGGGGH